MSSSKQTVLRLLGEAALIIGSVYIAIVLEGASDQRDRTADAVTALSQLSGELREDHLVLQAVIAEQEGISRRYLDLLRWFEDASTLPSDSVQETLDLVAYSNRTMFPRSAAWTTMVASGQLGLLDDPALVTRLGNLYEQMNARLIYNGVAYDTALGEVMGNSLPDMWDSQHKRLMSSDPNQVAALHGRLRFLYLVWNTWYLEYLAEYQVQVAGLIRDVDVYLDAHGPGVE